MDFDLDEISHPFQGYKENNKNILTVTILKVKIQMQKSNCSKICL